MTIAIQDQAVFGDFRDELMKEGFVVVKGAFSKENAAHYASKALDWLEQWDLGYKRDDESTWDAANLPFSNRGGLYSRYGSGHEQFAWDIRGEPGIIDCFAKIWNTEELLVSYDAVNISVPLNKSDEKNAEVFKPWPHTDQSPTRLFLHCVQGIANHMPNGPDDGGLMVLKGSKALYNKVWEMFDWQKPKGGWSTDDVYLHTPEMLSWLYEQGCEWYKVVAEPGDLILWDSRTIHYGTPPLGKIPRIATYVCYKPAALISEEQLAIKLTAFEQMRNHTHDPISFRLAPTEIPRENDKAWLKRQVPLKRPVLSDRLLQLAGVKPY